MGERDEASVGERMEAAIEGHMRRTYGPRVLGGLGGLAGLLRLDFNEKLFKRNFRDPVLVASADGVGSKAKLAAELRAYDTIGQDVVAVNVNGLVERGAEPLLFLDYIGVHGIDPAVVSAIVKGVADGCELAGCALLGGETAELPDVYGRGDFDLVGFSVGVCELGRVVDGSGASAGDVVLGLASSGLHASGHSLARAVVKKARLKWGKEYGELGEGSAKPQAAGRTLREVLLAPTRVYARSIVALLRQYRVKRVITGMAHITEGGLAGNVPRAAGAGLNAMIERGAWEVPGVFRFLRERGGIGDEEMYRVFNMGVGFVLVVRPHFAEAVAEKLERLGETVYRLGKLERGTGRVVIE